MNEFTPKNPADTAALFNIDFSDVLASSAVDGETLSSVDDVTCQPTGLTIVDKQVLAGGKIVQVQIDGGTAPTDYVLFVKVTTSGGQSLTRPVLLPVRDTF